MHEILAATRRSTTAIALALGALLGSGAQAASAPGDSAPLASLPGWQGEDLTALGTALTRQCALVRPPEPWPVLCRRGIPQDAGALRGWLERGFRAWPLVGSDGGAEGLITGYYEPVLTGSRTREGATQVPAYPAPPRPAGGAGYPARAEIETAPSPIAAPLLWLDDEIDAFFLHVQGSGRVRLRDGSLTRIGFAAHNGQAYVPIGRVLVQSGELAREAADMQGIRAWLRERLVSDPQRAREVMRANPRYIFFRELGALPDDAGPPGSLGVPLTALRSVATDPAAVPPGSLLFVETTLPGAVSPTAFARVVVSQDTGAAITGAVRADLFTGTGASAGELAGRMRQRARIWLLWPAESRPAISPSIR